jgi:tRNA-2-methylthio-N6-dimethylallyladenosine synthase
MLSVRAVKNTTHDAVTRAEMLPGTFYIETFGCQMNERDSETIAALLSRGGMTATRDPRAADVILLNTCAVRESAESKVWSRLGKLAAMRRAGPMPVMALVGCMAQIQENVERIRQRVPFVQVVAGPGSIHRIPSLVRQAREAACSDAARPATKGPGLTAVSPPRSGISREESTQVLPEGLPRKDVPGVTAFVTIMYGCDNFCSYCVVPFVRGPQVSRPREAITQEVESLAALGCKEVTLLGQNVNAYGHDLGDMEGFSRLLRKLNQVPGLWRIRYLTSHPRDFTRETVDAVRECGKVCEHFHLPLQSGSDRILTLMNRGYTRSEYLALLDYIRETVPGPSLTTDIIVGFPTETEEDFQDTLKVLRGARFDGAFTFVFSPRKGTAAAGMKGQVSRAEKSERMQELVEVQSGITAAVNRELVGRQVEILVESADDQEPGAVRGRTRTGKLVIAQAGEGQGRQGSSPAPGDLVTVRVIEAGTWYLKGPVVR